ncbi:hypothetical protein [Clostridium folliculivorans]|uniref:Uncharacterized protein n=1 Tax=Clostridium folliculivorans TaxID=2886038 RepID=A0A9W5Y1Q3_9CLOT|nr:hypothetical protein [Clostridium folliculivorans]GKU24934.1 hypothetical protein CFOLD11_17600 [Clostridium folliculivorans]GKU31032.1 hypothetical protein CFB3_31390 [Clostridium folliculivorans]
MNYIISYFKFLIFFFMFCITLILQVFLSKRKNKWLGLILPIISFMISLLVPLNTITDGRTTTEVIAQFLVSLILANIPTIIFVLIYIICRDKYKKKKEMDKIDIRDLH